MNQGNIYLHDQCLPRMGYQIDTYAVDKDALYLAQLEGTGWTRIPSQIVNALLRAGAIVKEQHCGKGWTVINNGRGDEPVKLPRP